jgi:ABC-2 type transport system permease protein
MNLTRIWAIILRHLLLTTRHADRIAGIFYWPLINIVLWGITGTWLQQKTDAPELAAILLTALVLWQIVIRINAETARGVIEELINHNLVNLFSTPLTFYEWVIGISALGILNMTTITLAGALCVYLFFGINIFAIGPIIVVFMLLLLLSGWTIGLIMSAFLSYWGIRAQDLLFIIVWAFAPFSAIYYPLSVAPLWMQYISYIFPMAYTFESLRIVYATHQVPYLLITMSFILNCLYLMISIGIFKYFFSKSQEKGLARL